MLRSGYAEKTFTVSTSSSEPILIQMEYDTLLPQINPWITLEPNLSEFYINSGKSQEFKVTIRPPADTPNGYYSTYLHFVAVPNISAEGRTVAIIQTAVAMRVEVSISDFEIKSCKVISSGIISSEKGEPVTMLFQIFNNGNVVNTPTFKLDIWDQSQTEIVKTLSFSPYSILPTIRDSYYINVSTNDIAADQYFAEMTVPDCDNYRNVETFDILAPGTVSTSGDLVHIKNDAWFFVGDTVDIAPVFINTGEKTVSAQFKGFVFRDGKLVDTLDSETLDVMPQQTIEFPFYYVPKTSGRYIVKGRVFYDKKRTFEIESRFNVNPEELKDKATGKLIADIDKGKKPNPVYFIVILAAIGVLVAMIQRKRGRIIKQQGQQQQPGQPGQEFDGF
jgi:hypothetical protein